MKAKSPVNSHLHRAEGIVEASFRVEARHARRSKLQKAERHSFRVGTRDGNRSDRNHVDLSIRSESDFSDWYLKPEDIRPDQIVVHIRYGPVYEKDKHGTSPI